MYFASQRTLEQISRKSSSEVAVTAKVIRALTVQDGCLCAFPSEMDENSLEILGFEDEYPSQGDLTAFMCDYRMDAVDATYSVVLVNGGGYDPSHPVWRQT